MTDIEKKELPGKKLLAEQLYSSILLRLRRRYELAGVSVPGLTILSSSALGNRWAVEALNYPGYHSCGIVFRLGTPLEYGQGHANGIEEAGKK